MCLKSGPKTAKTLYSLVMALAILVPCSAQSHNVQIYGGTGCVQAQNLESQLTKVLDALAPNRQDTQNLTVRIALSLSAGNLSVSLKLADESGQIALARRYRLNRQDCPDVSSLLQLVLEEFLREFPENPWHRDDSEIASSAQTPPRDLTRLKLGLTVLANLEPWNSSFETHLHLEGAIKGDFHWLAGLHLRAAVPQNALDGGYQRFDLLLGAGVTTYAWQTHWDLEVLGGLLILQGDSFEENYTALAPNIEIHLGTRWQWAQFSMGPRLGVQIIKHDIQVLPSNARAHISIVNLGLSLQYDMN
ncbi:MAG: hypothetical protein HOK28_16915 [Deltaproteobacteria bacterium]|nr:hypothetical protein [Deltaproteobacteria bacterium]